MASLGCDEQGPLPNDQDLVGPGWFESSWDLMRGLVVREYLHADLGLDEWLAAELFGASDECLAAAHVV